MGKNTQKTIRRTGRRTGNYRRGDLKLVEKVTREFSSGGAVYRDGKWLIAKTTVSLLFPKQVWRLPKGHIDEGESLEQTAIREVKEESGVEAKIVKKIETIKYFYTHPENGKIFKFVTFFLMEWVADLPEGFDDETSEIAWLSFDEAYKTLSFPGEKQILKKAQALL